MKILAQNRKALFNYEIVHKYVAGLVLAGSEIKAIRSNNISLQDSYVTFDKNEPFIINMNIGIYKFSSSYKLEMSRKRKLLLNNKEIIKLQQEQKTKGLVIIPVKLFLNSRNLAKIEIALAKGKKLYDKRNSIKEREIKRKVKEY